MLRIDPAEPIDSNDPADASDSTDPADSALRNDRTEPADIAEYALPALRQDVFGVTGTQWQPRCRVGKASGQLGAMSPEPRTISRVGRRMCSPGTAGSSTAGAGPIDVFAHDSRAVVTPAQGDIVDTVGAGDIFGASAAHIACQRAGAEPPTLAELTAHGAQHMKTE